MDTQLNIAKLWFDDGKIYISTADGKQYSQSLLWYHRLLNATTEQRNNYRFSYSGIHFPDIDEDISFDSFLERQTEPQGISLLFLTHPELNASDIARRLGMKQSLLAAYIRGYKQPPSDKEEEIRNAIRNIGKELAMT
ncbi:MAG: DUF2442 domain-containing protein [Tannerella sp.]|jgi:hypothetical protein|nr:DUF2442 domain-containing protein [Tannerella sp.]